MDDKRAEAVSYIVYEASQTRSDRIIHRLIIALLLSVLLLFVSNAIWIYAWTHLESSTTIENTNGTSNYIGADGEIHNEG